MEALLLSAGRGTRLLPVTRTYPKPLFPVLNMPSLVYIMRHLESFGIRDFLINTFHLAQTLEEEASKFEPKLNPCFSREEKLLGTGGGIKRMLSKTQGDTILVSNTDAVYNFDIKDLMDSHAESGCPITLGLIPHEEGYARVGVDEKGLIKSFRGESGRERGGIFAGIHVLTKSMLPEFPDNDIFCIIEDYYGPFVKDGGRINSRFLTGDFLDIGDLKKYFSANLRLLSDPSGFKVLTEYLSGCYFEREKGIFVHKKIKLPEDLKIEPPAVLGDCSIGKGCSIGPGVIIGDGCQIEENAAVERSIAFPNSLISGGSSVKKSIVYGYEKINAESRT